MNLTFFSTTSPLAVAAIVALIEVATFYRWHWPYKHLFPAQFRTFLMAKGVLKGATMLGLTWLGILVSNEFGWLVLITHSLIGIFLHIRWCRSHGINPLTVQPRHLYAQGTADWVNNLIDKQQPTKK